MHAYGRWWRGLISTVSGAGKVSGVYSLYQSWGRVPGMAEDFHGELAWSCGFAAHSSLCCSGGPCTSLWFSSVQFNSVTQSCLTLCDPMNHGMPSLPVHHCLPKFTQTHVHRVCDAIQQSHPQSSLSPTALNPSQHQSLFQ